VALVGLVSTSAALTWLDSAAGSAPIWLQIALVATVTAAIGLFFTDWKGGGKSATTERPALGPPRSASR